MGAAVALCALMRDVPVASHTNLGLYTDHQVADTGCGGAIHYLLASLALLAATLGYKHSV